jgi:hypothetical protein
MMLNKVIGFTFLTLTVGANAASISFDEGVGVQDGTISYDGTGGALVGAGIDFYTVLGDSTPSNSGVVLSCVGCELNFTTGAYSSALGSSLFFGSGGTFTVTGQLFDGATSVASGTLVSGSFVDSPNATVFLGSAIFAGFGEDEKNQDLLDFYGITAPSFTFASAEVALGTCSALGSSGGFACDVQDADLVNTAVVPLPGAAWLFCSALLGLSAVPRRRTV